MIKIKRVYDTASRADGKRFLVERLWPRGIKKEKLKLDGWFKELGPSTELRKWFNHDPDRWAEFQSRYRAELDEQTEALGPILAAAKAGTVTLLFSSHDALHNNVVALKAYLENEERIRPGMPSHDLTERRAGARSAK